MGARAWLPILGSVVIAVAATPAAAQIKTDATLGRAPRTLAGPDYAIGDELGARAGRNLFHSFETFSLATGERATFSGPDEIQNVISRVTGGHLSSIDGTIRSTIAGADVYFINPAGIVFGPNASLDLQGSFHVSTADELRFSDRATFSATDPGSSLTVAAPEAFGFLGVDPRRLAVESSLLEVPPGEALSIVGGDVDLRLASLRAEAGRITVAAVGGSGQARLDDSLVVADRRAGITLRDQSRLSASGDGGGRVVIRGGRVVVDDQSEVLADNLGAAAGRGGVDVAATAVSVLGGSALAADAFGAGTGGTVSIRADELEIADGGRLTADTRGDGRAGRVAVSAGDVEVRSGGFVRSSTFAAGAAGAVAVAARQLHIVPDGSDQLTGILSDARASGDGGSVTVTVTGDLELRDGGEIRASTFADGDAGAVVIEAGRLLISGEGLEGLEALTAISSSVEDGSTGEGGTVTVTADDLELRADGKIRSVTLSSGAAGTVTVTADRVILRGGGQISSSTLGDGTGRSGDVVLTAREGLDIAGQGRFPSPRTGVLPPSGVFASTESRSPDALPGGTVAVIAPVVQVADHGEISSESFGGGRGGAVAVTAADRLEIDAGEVSTEARSTGPAGAIRVGAGVLELHDGASIHSNASGEGAAGSVTIRADRLLSDRSAITTEAQQSGGGGITLEVDDLLVLADGSRLTSSIFGDRPGDQAGNIAVDPRFLIIDRSDIIARANAGDGGQIAISADNLLRSPGSSIDASSRTGIAGTVVINTPEVDLSGGLVVLEGSFVDTTRLPERCGVRRDIGASSFTGVGRAALPPSPDGPLASGHVGADVASAAPPTPLPAAGLAPTLAAPCAPQS